MKGFIHESTHNESKEWYTPREIFEGLGLEFDMDPCSPGKKVVPWIPATTHLTIRENGLIQPWDGLVFMNPPYGNDTPKWFRRLAEHGNGIGLVFARTDTKWFHNYIPGAGAVLFIKGRVQFVPGSTDAYGIPLAFKYAFNQYTPKGGCGAASMLVGYGREATKALLHSNLGQTFVPANNEGEWRC